MARTKQMKSDQWTETRHQVLSNLDIIAVYKELGVEGIGQNNGEWVPCCAFGKEDRTPSAGINVSRTIQRGQYKDFTSDDHAMSLFDFSIKVGRFGSYFESLSYYAALAGVPIPKAKHPSDFVEPVKYNSALAATWFHVKPPITERAFLAAGGCLAKSGKEREVRIALPVYGSLVDKETEIPIGWIIWHRLGVNLKVKNGDEYSDVKMKTVAGSESGMIGLHGLKNIRQSKHWGIWSRIGMFPTFIFPMHGRKAMPVMPNIFPLPATTSRW